MRVLHRLVPAIIAMAAVAGCGGSDSTSPPPGGNPNVVEIRLTANSTFLPATVTIEPGTTVRWVNDVAMEHTVTPENTTQPGVWQRRQTSTAGVVFEHTFNSANQTYRYRCEPHSPDFQTGMVGVITVTGG